MTDPTPPARDELRRRLTDQAHRVGMDMDDEVEMVLAIVLEWHEAELAALRQDRDRLREALERIAVAALDAEVRAGDKVIAARATWQRAIAAGSRSSAPAAALVTPGDTDGT